MINSNDLDEFLRESNAIEQEYSEEALQDAKQAWMCGFISMKDEPLSIDLILAIHRRLLKRISSNIAGKIRNVPVMIGGEIRSQSKEEIKKLLQEWCDIWNNRRFVTLNASSHDASERQYREDFIKEMHVEFEKIHPFQDGNGRTGRILMNLQRLKMEFPLLIIHTGQEQMSYYKWFKENKDEK